MKRTILALSILLFAAMLSAPVLAGDVITVTDVQEVNGKIGLYIRNDVGLSMRTDNSEDNTSVLNYFVNNETIYSIPSESADRILTEAIKLVVIDHAWPETEYATVGVAFKDTAGHKNDREISYAFAKPGMELISTRTDPELITSNASFTIYLTMKASGEKAISNINAEYLEHPKYYTFVSDSYEHTTLGQNGTADYAFTYKLSGRSMPETIVYETINIPLRFSYRYFGKYVSWVFNETVVIYNRQKIGNNLPTINSLIDVSNTLIQGNVLDVPVFVWNSKSGSHSACKINLTLSEESGEFEFPTKNILPSDKTFPPGESQSSDPTAIFTMELPESIPEGEYDIVLSGNYVDCEWNAPQSFKHTKTVSVVKKTVIDDTPVAPPSDDEKIGDVEGSESSLPKLSPGAKKAKNYLLWIFLLIGVIIGVVFVLEKRGRRI
jgi:hypothetical protein